MEWRLLHRIPIILTNKNKKRGSRRLSRATMRFSLGENNLQWGLDDWPADSNQTVRDA